MLDDIKNVDIAPLLSVIVPIYNVEKYLEKCVRSIQAQTYRNLEIILVDDGSPDRCGEIADCLATEDPRIRVFHKPNSGVAAARNLGLDNMHGEFFTFIDPDDYLDNVDVYAVCMKEIILDKDLSIVQYSNKVVDSESNVIEEITPERQEVFSSKEEFAMNFSSIYMCQKMINASGCDKIFRSSLLGEIRFKNLRLCEDVFYLIDAFESANKILVLTDQGYCYFHREGSAVRSAMSDQKRNDYLRVIARIYSFLRENTPDNAVMTWRYAELGIYVTLYKCRFGINAPIDDAVLSVKPLPKSKLAGRWRNVIPAWFFSTFGMRTFTSVLAACLYIPFHVANVFRKR